MCKRLVRKWPMRGCMGRMVSCVAVLVALTACNVAARPTAPTQTVTPLPIAPTSTATEVATSTTEPSTPTDTAVLAPTDTDIPLPTDTATIAPTDTATPCPAIPAIASFVALPDAITAGDTLTLKWGAVTNAATITIDNDIGAVRAPGSKAVQPGSTTTYVLTATGCGDPQTAQVTVTVYPPLPTPNPGVPQGNEDFQPVLDFSWGLSGELLPDTTYGIEIQIKRAGQTTFRPFLEVNGLTDTTFQNTGKPFPNNIRQLRFRVWQVSKQNPAQHSGRSEWSIITIIHP